MSGGSWLQYGTSLARDQRAGPDGGRQPGVEEVHVSLAHEEALARYDPNETPATKIKDTLRGLGYTVRDPRKIEGIEEQEAAMEEEKKIS